MNFYKVCYRHVYKIILLASDFQKITKSLVTHTFGDRIFCAPKLVWHFYCIVDQDCNLPNILTGLVFLHAPVKAFICLTK